MQRSANRGSEKNFLFHPSVRKAFDRVAFVVVGADLKQLSKRMLAATAFLPFSATGSAQEVSKKFKKSPNIKPNIKPNIDFFPFYFLFKLLNI
jgi:hypothetical protein